MAEAAVMAAQGDADKVRANGVRAVGALLGLLNLDTAQQAGLEFDRCVLPHVWTFVRLPLCRLFDWDPD